MAESVSKEGRNGAWSEGGGVSSGPAPSCTPSRPRSARGAGSGDDERVQFRHSDTASDSTRSLVSQEPENSDDNLSQSSFAPGDSAGPPPSSSSSKVKREGRKKRRKARQEWEILEGLREGQRCADRPDRYQGCLLKRRKWPMKGWHKRYFVLDRGILTYAKSPQDIQKGKYHGVIDTGLAVLTYKRDTYRLDIDAEELVHHIKVKSPVLFEEWLSQLRQHRLYRQHEIAYGTKDSPRLTEITSPSEEIPPLTTANLPEKTLSMGFKGEVMRQSSFKALGGAGQGRVAAWVLDTAGFEQCTKSLSESQNMLCEMSDILEQLKSIPLTCETPSFEFSDSDICEKRKSRFGGRSSKRKDKKNGSPTQKELNTAGLQIPTSESMRTSASNPNLFHYAGHQAERGLDAIPLNSSHESRILDIKLRENFMSKAETVHKQLKSLVHTMNTERERLKQSLESDPGASATISSLRQSLCEVRLQNMEMRTRLLKIHAESSVPDNLLVSPLPSPPLEKPKAPLVTSLSAESFSLSEYYDAEENVLSDSSSSQASDDDESELSEEGTETDFNAVISASDNSMGTCAQVLSTGRRSKLPAPKPDTGDISLWSLLYKNIGKDLTKISMPVTLNEPLSALQRLGEELEYSELLDKAAEYDDPYERMIYVAAFAVSCYASAYYRAGHKPFNPLLGETYECLRMDKGWRFVAEQVSHHPPISACHAESKNFIFWQDVQMKTKFWGKSMEIQPVGMVNVTLSRFQDHYKWNKVTTCVHNLLGGQRWVDHYGEMTINNGGIVCKLTFKKSPNWSAKRHEVSGHILNPEGRVVHNLFGLWNEAFFCGHHSTARCIWRPGAMPEDYELYYGFTRFAMELNEFDPEQTRFLPPTDSRFRPDQRLLEEGRVHEAENEKHRVEHLQREKRKSREDQRQEHQPRWFKKEFRDGREAFMYSSRYWEVRRDPGFARLTFQKLW